jgi:hypothetical protein
VASEDGGDAILRNMRSHADYTELYPRSGNIQVSETIIQSIVRVEQIAEQPITTRTAKYSVLYRT